MKQQNNFKKFQIKVDKITDMYYNDYSKYKGVNEMKLKQINTYGW